ncbi:hypothetical protein GXW82_44270 [Streptacidiphilus sp. 4-A2]|nr:hypothetical protein [Streptacidiphilus sp. 4-A2]
MHSSHYPATPLDGRYRWGFAMGLGVPAFAAHKVTWTPANLADIRRFTRATLSWWHLPQQAETVTSVAHELLLQAIRITRPRGRAPGGWIGLAEQSDTVTCTLNLTDTAHPSVQPRSLLDADDTLSTQIIHALATNWDLPSPSHPGTVLQATIAKGPRCNDRHSAPSG